MVGHGGACQKCAWFCQSMHYNKTDSSPAVTSFIKLCIGDEFSEKMILPPAFARTVKDLVNQETKIEDSMGEQWTVSLSYYQGQLAFGKGWTKFSSDHSLQVGSILVFYYIRGSHFVCHIYGKSCLEKKFFKRSILVERDLADEKINCLVQSIEANALESYENGRPVKRARNNGEIDSQEMPVGIFHNVNSDGSSPSVRSMTRGGKVAQDTLNQETNTFPFMSDMKNIQIKQISTSENGRPVKRTRNSGEIDSQEMPVGIFHTNVNSDRSSPSVRSMTRGSKVAQDTLNQETNIFPFMLDMESIQIKPISTSETPDPESCNATVCMDEACCLIIERDAEYAQTEDRTHLYDLSTFEMENKCFVGKCTEGTVVEKCSPGHMESILGSSFGCLVDGNHIGAAVENVPKASRVNDIGILEKEDSGPIDDIPCEREKVQPDGLSSCLPSGGSFMELAGNDEEPPFPNEDATLNCGTDYHGMVFSVDTVSMAKQEQVRMGKKSYRHTKKSRRLESASAKVCGSSSQGPDKVKVMKIEPVDLLNVPQVRASVSLLAVTDGREFVELDEQLLSITIRKGRQHKSLLLQDPEGRRWPAIYTEQSKFFVLMSGWKYINDANGVQPGDHYVLSVEDESDGLFKMDFIRNQEGN